MVISLQFSAFDILVDYEYDWEYYEYDYDSIIGCFDHLTITDGDGTTLMERSCGSSSGGDILIGDQSMDSTLPPDITSKSNIVKLVFSTDVWTTRTGWSVSWSAVAPGECQQHVWIFLDHFSNSLSLTIMVDNALSISDLHTGLAALSLAKLEGTNCHN